MDYKRIPYDDFVSIYHKVPRVAVDLIVKTNKGIVLTKRSIPPCVGMWHVPGGSVLFMEPITHAIDRIAEEEMGISIAVVKHLGVNEYFKDDGRHTVCNAYLVEITGGKLRGSKQAEEVGTFETIPVNIIPEQKVFLEKYYKDGRIK